MSAFSPENSIVLIDVKQAYKQLSTLSLVNQNTCLLDTLVNTQRNTASPQTTQ